MERGAWSVEHRGATHGQTHNSVSVRIRSASRDSISSLRSNESLIIIKSPTVADAHRVLPVASIRLRDSDW